MRSKLLVGIALQACCLVAATSPAAADPWSDSFQPRAVALGEALRGAAFGSAAPMLNPAGVAMSRTYVLETDFGYRSKEKALAFDASVCDSMTSRVGACLYYNYVGGKLDTRDTRLHVVGLTTAMPLSSHLAFGVNQKYVDYNDTPATDAADTSHKGYLIDAGLALQVAAFLNLGVAGYNLVGSEDPRFPRGIGAGAAAFLGGHLQLSADARWNLADDTVRVGGGAEYFITSGAQQGIPLRAGYVYDQANGGSYVTGGVGLISARVGLDVALRQQVDAGSERLLLFGLRIFLPDRSS